MVAGWSPPPGMTSPAPPTNGTVTSPFVQGVLDVRWDNPALLSANTGWTILGVNVYRSDNSDRGPFKRLNQYPIGIQVFRDFTDCAYISRELVDWNSSWLSKGTTANTKGWVFKTQNPIAKRQTRIIRQQAQVVPANSAEDVVLTIDGQVVRVDSVFGPTGEVSLVIIPDLDPVTQMHVGPVLPIATSEVLISYYTARNAVLQGVDKKCYYRVTSVALDPTQPSGLNETPLAQCPPIYSLATEQTDYIWMEAIRRNQWMLSQGGEYVKVFVRKVSGIQCFCGKDPRTIEFNSQPSQRCYKCFGVGFIGGFEGPYDIWIAPDNGERRIAQGPTGRNKSHTTEVFMGPTPMVSQRDFIVKQTNERYSIGPVTRPTNRGMVLQQQFNIGYLDSTDIRYEVPIDGYNNLLWPQTRDTYFPYLLPRDEQAPSWPVGPDSALPMVTDNPNAPEESQHRGRTRVWENIVRG